MTTPRQTKPLKPVERGTDGKLKSGTPNPGGLTSEQRQARDALNKWLCDAPQLEKGKAAYLQLLQGDSETPPNPVIVKDFMDRVAGKVKEHVELSGSTERPLAGLSADDILAALKGPKP
jgi:hypothetical protein